MIADRDVVPSRCCPGSSPVPSAAMPAPRPARLFSMTLPTIEMSVPYARDAAALGLTRIGSSPWSTAFESMRLPTIATSVDSASMCTPPPYQLYVSVEPPPPVRRKPSTWMPRRRGDRDDRGLAGPLQHGLVGLRVARGEVAARGEAADQAQTLDTGEHDGFGVRAGRDLDRGAGTRRAQRVADRRERLRRRAVSRVHRSRRSRRTAPSSRRTAAPVPDRGAVAGERPRPGVRSTARRCRRLRADVSSVAAEVSSVAAVVSSVAADVSTTSADPADALIDEPSSSLLHPAPNVMSRTDPIAQTTCDRIDGLVPDPGSAQGVPGVAESLEIPRPRGRDAGI